MRGVIVWLYLASFLLYIVRRPGPQIPQCTSPMSYNVSLYNRNVHTCKTTGALPPENIISRWCHQMETFSALLALWEGISPVTGEFHSQRPVTRSLDAFFDLCLNKMLSKPSTRRWFETPLCSLWHHCNVLQKMRQQRSFDEMLGWKASGCYMEIYL